MSTRFFEPSGDMWNSKGVFRGSGSPPVQVSAAFSAQIEEVDRAMEKLIRSGQLYPTSSAGQQQQPAPQMLPKQQQLAGVNSNRSVSASFVHSNNNVLTPRPGNNMGTPAVTTTARSFSTNFNNRAVSPKVTFDPFAPVVENKGMNNNSSAVWNDGNKNSMTTVWG